MPLGPGPHGPQGDSVTRFLLLHGLAGQPGQWRWLAAELEARGHQVEAPKLPGGTWATDCAFVRERAEQAVLVGHSLGGLLVRMVAEAHPGVAAGLATIGAPSPAQRVTLRPSRLGVFQGGWYRVTDLDGWLEAVAPGGPPELRDLAWEHHLYTDDMTLAGGFGAEPRLAIVCEEDGAVPYEEQLEAARGFRAPVASVPGGHSPHVRHPALVATLLLNWLTPQGA